ncbi:hypothetical protein F5B20DRAFT_562225 [Whalleya microplaca]|nr:hypothetical protein F5B20DRAFT_562225 [Whalleya microplaca]
MLPSQAPVARTGTRGDNNELGDGGALLGDQSRTIQMTIHSDFFQWIRDFVVKDVRRRRNARTHRIIVFHIFPAQKNGARETWRVDFDLNTDISREESRRLPPPLGEPTWVVNVPEDPPVYDHRDFDQGLSTARGVHFDEPYTEPVPMKRIGIFDPDTGYSPNIELLRLLLLFVLSTLCTLIMLYECWEYSSTLLSQLRPANEK